MAKSPFSKRDERHDIGRRALIKWTVAAGAALGVSRSKVFDILERTAGKGVAYAAATNPVHRWVGIEWGNGGLAWTQLLYPHPDIAAAANPNFAYQAPGQGALMAGTDKPLWIGPDTPGQNMPAQKQPTCFVAGANNTHQNQAQQGGLLGGASIYAIGSVLQAAAPSVIPIIQVGDVAVGAAPGFGQPTAVNNGGGIVGLFNSAASRAGGLLSNLGDAQLYKAQYDAFAQLNRAAAKTTQRASYTTASSAAQFLGTNLAAKLAITDADRTMYGISGATRGNVLAIAEALIVSVKAFGMGLTNAVLLPAMRDDPHGAFASNDFQTVPRQLKAVFDGFFAHLAATTDEATGVSLIDDTVMTWRGDTMKDPRDRQGWPDGTSQNANRILVWGNGHLKTGWHGDYNRNGNVQGILPNGTLGTYNANESARLANASAAYAIVKKDVRAINPFTNNLSNVEFWRPADQ